MNGKYLNKLWLTNILLISESSDELQEILNNLNNVCLKMNKSNVLKNTKNKKPWKWNKMVYNNNLQCIS